MATAAIIVLSSSPGRPCLRTTPSPTILPDMSSSPALPSPSQLITKRRPSLASGNRLSPVPSGSITSFTRASSLLCRTHSARDDVATARTTLDVGVEAIVTARQRVPTKSRKVAAQKLPASENTAKRRKVRKNTVTANEEDQDGVIDGGSIGREVIVKPLKVKRTRAVKDSEPRQTTIERSKITKPSTSVKGVKKDRSKTKFQNPVTGQDPVGGHEYLDNREVRDEGTDWSLSEAVGRRKDWTPPKDTEVPFNIEQKPWNISCDIQSKPVRHSEIGNKQFENLLSDYGYAQIQGITGVDRGVSRGANGEALNKRRKLEASDVMPCCILLIDIWHSS